MPLPTIVAHRGFSARYRENSPAAWRGAIEAGADVIEVDLRVTADRHVVCMHDADLVRLAGKPDRVAETSSAALAGMEADGFPAAPPLPVLFATVPPSQALLFDIKDERPEALRLIVEALLASGRERLILGLHRVESLKVARSEGWAGQVLGLLTDMGEEEEFFAQGGDIIRVWESVANPERMEALAGAGRPVWITTGEHTTGRRVGDHDPASLLAMARAGAQGFLVNDPVAARGALMTASGGEIGA